MIGMGNNIPAILEPAAVNGSFSTWSTLEHLGALMNSCYYNELDMRQFLVGILQRMTLLDSHFLAKWGNRGADYQGLQTRWAVAGGLRLLALTCCPIPTMLAVHGAHLAGMSNTHMYWLLQGWRGR
jgi:hypothetical protein